MGTYGGGLHKITLDSLNSQLGRIQHYPITRTKSNAANHIYTICTDHTGAVWVGTNGEGIYRFWPEEINAGDKNIRRYVQYKQNYENTHGLTDNYVLSLYEDRGVGFGPAPGMASCIRLIGYKTALSRLVTG